MAQWSKALFLTDISFTVLGLLSGPVMINGDFLTWNIYHPQLLQWEKWYGGKFFLGVCVGLGGLGVPLG